MLYSILFAGLIYLNNGQIDISEFPCDAQTACSSYTTLAGAQAIGLGNLNSNLNGESFTCSDTLGYCTVTCTSNSQNACDAVGTTLGVTGLDCIQGICDYNETNTCTDSNDCASKSFGSLLPRCDNPSRGTDAGRCVAQSDSPTTTEPTTFDPTTAEPTMRPTTGAPITARPTLPNDQTAEPTTAEPTPRPTTPEPTTTEPTPRPTTPEPTTPAPTTMYECNDDGTCAETNPTDEDYNCEVDATTAGVLGLDATCEDADSPCDAYCKLKVEMAAAISGLSDAELAFANANNLIPDNKEAFEDYCSSGKCPTTTTPKPTTPEPTTPEPTLGADETARPTMSPTTSAPTTPEPTVDAGSFTCNDDGTCASTGVADKPYNCEINALIASYANLTATCEDADNACDAFCALAKGIEDVRPSLDPGVANLIPDDEEALFDQFCSAGLCPTTGMPTTTTTSMATTGDCEDEDPYNVDCPEDPQDDCSLQFNVTVDFCVFNRKFKRRSIYRYVKLSFIRAINIILTDYEDFCDEDALRIEYYNIEVDDEDGDDTYRQRGRNKPTKSDECEDLDDICGSSRKLKKYSLSVSVGFYCGECERIKSIFTSITNLVSLGGGGFDTEYEAECYELSKNDDDVCDTGFGDVLLEITEAVLAYRNEDGEVEEVTTITGSATQRFYFIGLTVAFIIALLH